MIDKLDLKYMKLALNEAKKGYLLDEVPIGCVIVSSHLGKIFSLCNCIWYQ